MIKRETGNETDGPGSSPDADGLSQEEAGEAASGIVKVMKVALEAAIDEAQRPSWALAGLLLAARSLRSALPEATAMTEAQLSDTLDFVRETYVGEAKAACVAVACSLVQHRCTHSGASAEDVEAVVREAASCIEGLGRSGTVRHPVTMLVVLYAARQMVLALMKHQHPDEYEHMCFIAKTMENSVKPRTIGVVEMPAATSFTKGGDA